MRVIGGIYRSRKLEFPISIDIRPTRDMVREGVFNALGDIKNKRVLDIFAGTGAYGIEALSRGASSATFIDNNLLSLKCLEINIHNLKINDKCKVIKRDYQLAINDIDGIFDLVFIDPPYKLDIYQELINDLANLNLISDKSIIVLEWNKPLDIKCDMFNIKKAYKYKDNHILIMRN